MIKKGNILYDKETEKGLYKVTNVNLNISFPITAKEIRKGKLSKTTFGF